VRLSDYRVSVVDAAEGTGAQVRVLIEATDGAARWDAGCVSENIVDASFEALCSTAVMGIMRARSGARRSA
jgi:2-isopropylmalate synthase